MSEFDEAIQAAVENAFTMGGTNEKADRLQLMQKRGKGERALGGWCKDAFLGLLTRRLVPLIEAQQERERRLRAYVKARPCDCEALREWDALDGEGATCARCAALREEVKDG